MLFQNEFENLLEYTISLEDAPQKEPLRQAFFVGRCREMVSFREKILGRKLRCQATTLGCQMNAKDTEKLLGILKEIGYEPVEEQEEADFILYNTCTIRENANNKVYGHLGYLQSLKQKNPELIIALCGCMMQEKHVVDTVREKYRFVDIIFGTYNIYQLAEMIYRRLMGEMPVLEVWEKMNCIVEQIPSLRKSDFKAGVNITYGCNNFCTYCIVPYVRGREISREPEEILSEIRKLADDGVKEIMLLGQNVNSYGRGLEKHCTFAELLEECCKVDGIERIRFMTPHPKDFSDEVISVIARNEKICRHIHLPLQSGSTEILRRMNRRYTKEQYLALAERIREGIPDVALTTDIIVGFPGETEEDFEDTLDVVRRVRYHAAFTFVYSKRTGTPAASYEDQVSPEVVKERFPRLLEEIRRIAAEECEKEVGQVTEVLVEDIDSHEEGFVTGRMGNNLMVHFPGEASLIGQFKKVRLLESKGFYYLGEEV